MNDDSALMPPPPPRLQKRQKTAPSSPPPSSSAAATASAGERTHPNSIVIPRVPQQGRSAADDHDDGTKFGGGISSGGGKRAARSVSPEEFGMGSSSGNDGCWEGALLAGETPSSPDGLETSSFVFVTTDIPLNARTSGTIHPCSIVSSATVFGRIGEHEGQEDAVGGDYGFCDLPSTSDGVPPCDFSRGGDPHHNKISECESVRDRHHGGCAKKRGKQSHGCDSPPLVNVSFRDIIGHGQAKLRLDEALLPLALPPDIADSVLTGIRAAPASILLHGPPGCGKTKLAKAVAGEAQAAFLSIGPSDILSKFVGESEASIRGLFQEARRRAMKIESKCAVVFFDEIDALGRSRVDDESGKMSQAGGDNSSRRILAELLIQMTALNDNESGSECEGEEYDGYCDDGDSFSGRSIASAGTGYFERSGNTLSRSGREGNNRDNPDKMQPKPRVIVVAATNRPEDCDPALLRRFAVRVLVGLPSRKDRRKIIRRLLADVNHNITSAELDELALTTEGWSGSDLESMTREAVMAPVRECLQAAAILKRRENKVSQQSGTVSSQTQDVKGSEYSQSSTRESLLNSFRDLRPVLSGDFEDGIAFFLGDQNAALGHFGNNIKQTHYDSSSSSEDEA